MTGPTRGRAGGRGDRALPPEIIGDECETDDDEQ